MQIFELQNKIYLLKDVKQEEVLKEISSLIDITLGRDKKFLELHNKNCFKNYCFDEFYPLEKDKLYKADGLYNFRIRTTNKELAIYLSKEIPKSYTSSIKALKSEIKLINKKHIDKIYSISPLIVKNDCGYWRKHLSLEEYSERIKVNLIKKYNNLNNKKIDEDFILFNSIELKNKKPVPLNYKGIKLLGDKISLKISDDPIAQEIAYMSLGTGIGEVNTRGAGFVNFRYL